MAPADSSSGESSEEEDLESGWKEQTKARLKRVGFVLEEPSARCVLQNMQNVAFGLMLLALIGFVFGLLGIIAHDRLLSWNSFLLCFTAFGTAVTVGSDPCFLKHLRDSVALLGFQNRRLQESNGKLETQIKELSHISNSLDKVKGQLNNDAEATHDLLVALQHQGRVQAVSSSIGLFFVADRDKSGILDPKEAEVFLLGFSHLWDVIPDYPQEQLEHLQRDVPFQLYSRLLQAVVKEDAQTCSQILDELCEDPNVQIVQEVLDLRGPQRFKKDPNSSESSESSEESGPEERDKMKPWFTLGLLQIWGRLHLMAILLSLVAIVLWTLDLVCFNWKCLWIASLLLLLSLGLALQGQLVVIAQELRKRIYQYKEENDRLKVNVENMRREVSTLRLTAKGLESLQTRFNGNAQQAKRMLKHEIAQSKTSLVSAMLETFARADSDENGVLEGEELLEFFGTVDQVCKDIPGVAAQVREIQREAFQHGLKTKQIHELVERIVRLP
ncbi:unnamed protein product [Durusdinium trenchii]|uniref:EF-hand domain-containing protein n=1 Tax=Durusdinium trenchii TaxID=1381693 RepID=A0ABP0KP24_9DINO